MTPAFPDCFRLFLNRVDGFLQIPQVEVCFLCLPLGFSAVPQYFNSVPISQFLNRLDSPDFAWRTKNLLWDELNVLNRKLNVKTKQGIDDYRLKTSMVG
jgi:hypothetical protein